MSIRKAFEKSDLCKSMVGNDNLKGWNLKRNPDSDKKEFVCMGDHKRAWATAKKAAKVKNFRWHDLRHSWASWMAMEGVSLREIQELGGWAGPDMVGRYAHLSKEHLASKANAVGKAMKGRK